MENFRSQQETDESSRLAAIEQKMREAEEREARALEEAQQRQAHREEQERMLVLLFFWAFLLAVSRFV